MHDGLKRIPKDAEDSLINETIKNVEASLEGADAGEILHALRVVLAWKIASFCDNADEVATICKVASGWMATEAMTEFQRLNGPSQ